MHQAFVITTKHGGEYTIKPPDSDDHSVRIEKGKTLTMKFTADEWEEITGAVEAIILEQF